MKKTYLKPTMMCEEFMPNVAVAECSSQITGSVSTYPMQTVKCIVDGEETIFTSGTSGCSNHVSVESSGTNWYFETASITNSAITSGQLYFCWYDGQSNGKPNADQEEALKDLGISKHGWHAAPVTSGLENLYGFSY